MGKVIKDTWINLCRKGITQSKGKVTKDLQMGSTLIDKFVHGKGQNGHLYKLSKTLNLYSPRAQ
jgi:hypothetical protein